MMSLSGSSLSRNSSWAMMMLATWSSTAVPRKMIRSLSRREKMSQPRSPRWVCSMTVGMMKLRIAGGGTSLAHGVGSFFASRGLGFAGFGCFALRLFGRDDQRRRFFVGDLSLRDQHIKRLLFADLGLDLVDAVVLLQLGAQLLRVLVAGGRQLGDALLQVGVADRDAFALGDRLDQDRAARLLLGLAAELLAHLRVVDALDVDARHHELLLGAVDDQLRVALDQRGRDRELVALDQLLDQRARHLALDAPLVRLQQPLAQLAAQPLQRLRLARVLGHLVVERRAPSSRGPP